MVVHSPDAFEAKKAAAAAASRSREVGAAAGGAAGGAAEGVEGTGGPAGDTTGIPPSVLAAGSNPVPPATSVTPAEEADLLLSLIHI